MLCMVWGGLHYYYVIVHKCTENWTGHVNYTFCSNRNCNNVKSNKLVMWHVVVSKFIFQKIKILLGNIIIVIERSFCSQAQWSLECMILKSIVLLVPVPSDLKKHVLCVFLRNVYFAAFVKFYWITFVTSTNHSCGHLQVSVILCIFPSVLWRCWLDSRKGIRSVKTCVMGCWRGYLSGARCRLAYGPADATATHCLLLQ